MELNIVTGHFALNKKNSNREYAIIPLEKILIENSTYQSTSRLKERLLRAKLLQYKCAICGKYRRMDG